VTTGETIEDAVLSYSAIVSDEFDDERGTSPHITEEDVSAVVRRIEDMAPQHPRVVRRAGANRTRQYPSEAFERALRGFARGGS
jgi:hypothetical protein